MDIKKIGVILIGLIVIFLILLNLQFYKSEQSKIVDKSIKIEQSKTIDKKLNVEQAKRIKSNTVVEDNKDFYLTTLSVFKDFNELLLKYLTYGIGILTVFFFFFFRSSINDIKKELQNDSSNIKEVYLKTFDILNQQAETNLKIFQERGSDLEKKILDLNNIIRIGQSLIEEMSKNEKLDNDISGELLDQEVEKSKNKQEEIKAEVANYAKEI